MSGLVRAAVHGTCVVLVLLAMARFVVNRDALDHDAVFRGADDIALTGGDGWFHARHAWHAAQQWPSLVRFDAGAHYPQGLRTTHVGLWDFALGTAIRVSGASDDPVAARRLLARAAPAVGAVAVGLVAAIAFAALRASRRGTSRGTSDGTDRAAALDVIVASVGAVVAAWLLVHTPAHYGNAARLGEVDHHVVEPVLGWLSVAGIAVATISTRRRRGRVVLAVVGAAPLLVYLFTWVGAPLILGLLVVGVVMAAAVDVVRAPADVTADRERRGVIAWGLALLAGFGGIFVIEPLAVMEPTLGRPTLGTLVGLVVISGLLHGLARQAWWRSSTPARRAVVGVVVAGAVVAGLWWWPPTARLLTMLFEARADTVAEHREVTLIDVWARHGLSTGLSLFALGHGVWRLWSGARVSAAVGAGVALVVGVVGLWVAVHDYGTQVAPLLAVTGGIGAGLALEAVRARRGWAVAVVVVLLVLSATVTRWSGRPAVTLSPASAGRRILLTPAWRDALTWLRQAPPSSSPSSSSASSGAWDITRAFPTPPDMDLGGTPGVLASWDHGHLVAAIAGRPTVADHGPSAEAARVWTAPDEATALAALCPACGPGEAVRFIIADVHGVHLGLHPNLALAGVPPEQHVQRARVPLNGATVDVATVGGGTTTFGAQLWATPFPGASRVRAVWQSTSESLATHEVRLVDGRPVTTPRVLPVTAANRATLQRLAQSTPQQPRAVPIDGGLLLGGLLGADITIFEVVRGATVELLGPPRRPVTLTLPLQTPRGPVSWQTTGVLDDDGHARFVVPRATPSSPPDLARGNVFAVGPYTVAIDGVVVGDVAVAEVDVEEGRVVAASFMR